MKTSKASKSVTKVPVSSRALLARLNRKLAGDGRQVKAARGRDISTVGDFFCVDIYGSYVDGTHVDPEERARELGLLKPWEEVRP